MIKNLSGKMNETKISVLGNQMFAVLNTNGEIVKTRLFARIMKSM